MRIYFSHKRNEHQDELYKALRTITKHEFILPHDITQEPFDTKTLFEDRACDLVVAEVSEASTGQGIELGWANMYGIRIICFYKKGTNPALSLTKISDAVIPYSSTEELIENINGI